MMGLARHRKERRREKQEQPFLEPGARKECKIRAKMEKDNKRAGEQTI
jgi:hypothetical protein